MQWNAKSSQIPDAPADGTPWGRYDRERGQTFPKEFTFQLESGLTAGGRIVDDQGKPIAGARVQVMASPHARPVHSDPAQTMYDLWLATGKEAATTDAEGRWRIRNVPRQAALQLLVSHPDYASDESWGEAQQAVGVTTEMLVQGIGTVTLTRGISVHGRVMDATRKPIKGAIIVRGDQPAFASIPSRFPTDADGKFRLPPLRSKETTLTAIAPGWAPQLRRVPVHEGLPPQDFHLEPGKPIHLRIVDASGKPVPCAHVRITEWRGIKSLSADRLSNDPNFPKQPDLKIPRRADGKGIWEWTGAPGDPVKPQIYAKGFAIYQLEIPGGAPVRTVTLNAEPTLTRGN